MEHHKTNSHTAIAALLLMMCAMFIYYACATLFNTKGEPREAIVAVSMLQSGNWILPESFGADIPYKPPFMAWCIAAISWLFSGGNVTELTSRLPSIISAVVLVLATRSFFARHSADGMRGFLAAFITLTAVEVFRAATACRVDMMLTMFMVCSLYVMFDWLSRGARGIAWGSVLLMSGAFLTKGPVGVLLPALVVGIYAVIFCRRPFSAILRIAAACLLACILPALWYVAAADEGGSRFVDLVMEENFGRFTGTMSYGSHENPFWYNFLTIIAGMAPYTLLALFGLFSVGARKPGWTARLSNVSRFAVTAALVILIFFCIPKSKRSVYLLPMYPFMAYFVGCMIEWFQRCGRLWILRLFVRVIAVVGIIAAAAWAVAAAGLADSVKAVAALQPDYGTTQLICFGILAAAVVLACVWSFMQPRHYMNQVVAMAVSVSSIYIFANCAVLPAVLSAKSDIATAEFINRDLPAGRVYSYVDTPMLRFYTIGFYTSDRIKLAATAQQGETTTTPRLPKEGYLLVGERDVKAAMQLPGIQIDTTAVVYRGPKRSCDVKQTPLILKFKTNITK